MSAVPSPLSVCVSGKLVCVRVQGRATFSISPDFRRVINELLERGYEKFILDLTNCVLMDSTFLGVLAGMSRQFEESRNGGEVPCISIFQPSERVSDMLDNLGLLEMLPRICEPPATNGAFNPIEGEPHTKKQLSEICLEAHKLLMDLRPENAAKFKDVAKFLEEDLKRMREAETAKN